MKCFKYPLLAGTVSLCSAIVHAQGQPARAPSAFGEVLKSPLYQIGSEWHPKNGKYGSASILSMPSELVATQYCQSLQIENTLLTEQNRLLKKQVATLEDKLNPKKVAGSDGSKK